MPKVSVVIPVYNVEKFLKECLNSIVNQSLEDIEIICVNDGSTDNSLEILNEYSLKDDRMKIISQKNGGHAVATNNGMAIAKGEYLYLMDSDDILELNALEELYNYAENKNVDFVLFPAINYDNEEDKYYETDIYSMNSIYNAVEDSIFSYKDLGELIFEIPVTPWTKLYKNEFIKKINAKFPEGLIFDDNVFFWQIMFNAKRISFYNKHLFIRRWYGYSSTTSGDLRFLDSIDINNLIIDLFKEYGEFDNFKEKLYNRKVTMAFNRFNEIKSEFKNQYFEKLQQDFTNIHDSFHDDFVNNIDKRNEAIYYACLDSKDETEFYYKVALYDSEYKCAKMENQIVNLKNEKNAFLLGLKYQEDKKNQLLGKNRLLTDEVNYYKNSQSWKVSKPLRAFKKINSNASEYKINYNLIKDCFDDEELITISNVSISDSKHDNVDLENLGLIYDTDCKIPFSEFEKTGNDLVIPSKSLGRGIHEFYLKYKDSISEKSKIYVKDKNNLFDFNVWTGSDYKNDTSGFETNQLDNFNSTEEWAGIGNKSIKIGSKGDCNSVLLTPEQQVNIDDFIVSYVTVFNQYGEVFVRLNEPSMNDYEEIKILPSDNPTRVKITKKAKSNKMQMLIISKVKQDFFLDNFVFLKY